MPGESRESNSGCTIPVARNLTIVGMERSSTELQDRHLLGGTCIPLPKSGPFAAGQYQQLKIDSKLAKTEKNRLRLTMQSNAEQRGDDSITSSADASEKERRFGIATRDSQLPVQQNARTIPRYQAKYSGGGRNTDKKVTMLLYLKIASIFMLVCFIFSSSELICSRQRETSRWPVY